MEEPTSCTSRHTYTATLVLHGSAASFTMPHPSWLMCHKCDASAAQKRSTLEDVPNTAVNTKKKKRALRVKGPLFCSSCKKQVGFGVMIIVDRDGAKRRDDYVGAGLNIEAICMRCWSKYKFCTVVCGGCAGRWRPNKLFFPGRKLCNLSHDRVGMLACTHQVMSCPPALPVSLASTLIAFWEDVFPEIAKEAKLMEAHISLSDFAQVTARIHRRGPQNSLCPAQTWQEVAPSPTPGRWIAKILTIQWLVDDCIVGFTHATSTVSRTISHASILEVLESIIADAKALSVAAPQQAVAVRCFNEDEEEDPSHTSIGSGSAETYLAQQDAERAIAGIEPLDPVFFAVEMFEEGEDVGKWGAVKVVGVGQMVKTLDVFVGGRRHKQ
ncbi:hypothetical protein BDK51DRAFT_29530 [Blyttiomyces helicus]|uniref:Uncharacterized protein n=1 Tax=Blyttiomyces helicus TaxID=388810 RepID=A0A4V1IQS9_9FUNG|nr:hypothetical protein BDK51DRAFT_29530 [Blyttiomyces helicus]|eukprot:RKO87617.1 hypothetical protein BDK51DRAFT_29530 [Blyttiomyces helicus]